jgi:osmotically-inducible protein OsmY
MTFEEILGQVRELLQSKQRMSYRALKRQFALDDDYLEDLKAELIKAERVAVDEDGEVLVWTEGAPNEEHGMWDTASDMWITSATKMRLLADSQTPALDINVDTWGGVVTLFGIVPSQEAKAAAEADARKVSGVKQVENGLQVVANIKQAAGQVRDEELEHEVKKALATPEFKDIAVDVKNGVVRLTGTIPTGAQRLEAAVVVRAIPGVRAVEDDLRLADVGH